MSIEKINQLKEFLAGKVADKDAFEAAFEAVCPVPGFFDGKQYNLPQIYQMLYRAGQLKSANYNHHWAYIPAARWWIVREYLRAWLGVYEEFPSVVAEHTPVTIPIQPYLLHPSKDDRMMVAYTPTIEAGEQDKQRVTTLARYIRQYVFEATDDQARDVEALYRADMSGELTLLTTAADIERGYLTGPHSCMSYPRSNWANLDRQGAHPTHAYESPDLALAVLPGSDGKYSARCLVYHNPTDPNDKRYIRVYGDMALKRRLERNGYKQGTLVGARLKKILILAHPGHYVVPYLDSAGSGNRGERVVIDGEWLRVINAESAAVFEGLREYNPLWFGSGGTTGGLARVVQMPPGVGTYTCAITGQSVSITSGKPTLVIHEGEIKQTCWTALTDEQRAQYPIRVWAVDENGQAKRVAASLDTPVFTSYDGLTYDDERTRTYYGFGKLSSKYYPNRQDWINSATDVEVVSVIAPNSEPDTVAAFTVTHENETVLRDDVVHAVFKGPEGAPQKVRVHKSTVEGKDWKRVSRIDTTHPCYAHKSVTLDRTLTGRNVVVGAHAVVRTWDGLVVPRGQAHRRLAFGANIYSYEAGPRTRFPAPSDVGVSSWLDTVTSRSACVVYESRSPEDNRRNAADRMVAHVISVLDGLCVRVGVGEGNAPLVVWESSRAYLPGNPEQALRTLMEVAQALAELEDDSAFVAIPKVEVKRYCAIITHVVGELLRRLDDIAPEPKLADDRGEAEEDTLLRAA